jgi:hypothetical protein
MKLHPAALFTIILLAHVGVYHCVHQAHLISEKWNYNLFWTCLIANVIAVLILANPKDPIK